MPTTADQDGYMVSVFGASAHYFDSLKKSAGDAVDHAEHAVGNTVDTLEAEASQLAAATLAVLAEAGKISLALGRDLKDMAVAVAAFSDGCMGPITGCIASISGMTVSVVTFAAGTTADATGAGAVAGIPAQTLALAGMIASGTALLASIVGVIECKELQADAARDKAAQLAKDAKQAAADKARDEADAKRDQQIQQLLDQQKKLQQEADDRAQNLKTIRQKKAAIDGHFSDLKRLGAKVAGR
jgi:hypothetical protein